MRVTELSSPSSCTQGEGRGEGLLRDSLSSKLENIEASPHPNPLPEYKERGQDDPPSLRAKVLCAAVMSAAFLICYGSCIAITAARAPVPTLAFTWEKHIPFLPATIVPYMSRSEERRVG